MSKGEIYSRWAHLPEVGLASCMWMFLEVLLSLTRSLREIFASVAVWVGWVGQQWCSSEGREVQNPNQTPQYLPTVRLGRMEEGLRQGLSHVDVDGVVVTGLRFQLDLWVLSRSSGGLTRWARASSQFSVVWTRTEAVVEGSDLVKEA